MSNTQSAPIDLLQLRHDLTAAIGSLETAIEELRLRTVNANEAFELHQTAMDRLKTILSAIDAACPRKK